MPNFPRRLLAGLTLFFTEFALTLLLGVLGVVGFLQISREVFDQHAAAFDEAAFGWVRRLLGRGAGRLAWVEGITMLASRNFLVAASLGLMAYFLLRRRHRWYTLVVPVVALGGIALNLLLKSFYHRPRPLLPLTAASGLSYPSGHAMLSVTFYGLLIHLVHRHVRRARVLRGVLTGLLVLLILLIGLTRVYLRVHYATDVLAGFVAGAVWLLVAIPLLRGVEKTVKKRFARLPQLTEKQSEPRG